MSGQDSMITTYTQEGTGYQIKCVIIDGAPWFKAREVADTLGYTNTKKAIIDHVRDKHKKKLEELMGNDSLPLDYHTRTAIYINEPGLYSLILKSQKDEALVFQDWVTEEVLPSIRKHGGYATAPVQTAVAPAPSAIAQLHIFDLEKLKTDRYINLYNERELHIKVVQYIRRFYPDAVMMAGLGELQQTVTQRIEGKMKGYQKGCCDLMILNNHIDCKGLCIELKNPRGTGVIGQEQLKWLTDMHLNGHSVLISHDYDEITRTIDKHFERVRVVCPHCVARPQYFKTQTSLDNHLNKFHHNLKRQRTEDADQ